MSKKLPPIKLSGIVKPEYSDGGIDRTECIFWLLASAFGNEISIQGVGHDFVRDNKEFFLYTQQMGLSLGRHIYGADFSGYIENPVQIRASEAEDLLAMLAVASCGASGISKIEIDNPSLMPYAVLIKDMICALDTDAEIISGSVYINSAGILPGGTVETKNDWRIILACVLASTFAGSEITLTEHEALSEIYPDFWTKLEENSRERFL